MNLPATMEVNHEPAGLRSRRTKRGNSLALFCCGALGRDWHKADMPVASVDVRFRGESGHLMLRSSFSAFDAVDGAHSAASKCYRLVCVKARAIQGGEARKRRRRLKFEGIGEDMTT